jgi:hypothetical protein
MAIAASMRMNAEYQSFIGRLNGADGSFRGLE